MADHRRATLIADHRGYALTCPAVIQLTIKMRIALGFDHVKQATVTGQHGSTQFEVSNMPGGHDDPATQGQGVVQVIPAGLGHGGRQLSSGDRRKRLGYGQSQMPVNLVGQVFTAATLPVRKNPGQVVQDSGPTNPQPPSDQQPCGLHEVTGQGNWKMPQGIHQKLEEMVLDVIPDSHGMSLSLRPPVDQRGIDLGPAGQERQGRCQLSGKGEFHTTRTRSLFFFKHGPVSFLNFAHMS
jgi:hypothetical protein